jgi:putative ABC transport system permease protein
VTLALGLAIGLAGSFVVGRLLQGLLIQTSATDPATVVFIVAFLVLIAVAASVVPARRAARLDPLAVLRND